MKTQPGPQGLLLDDFHNSFDRGRLCSQASFNPDDRFYDKLYFLVFSLVYTKESPFRKRTLIFSNLPITRAKSRFPLAVEHCDFTLNFSNFPIFRTNFRFPWKLKKRDLAVYYFDAMLPF